MQYAGAVSGPWAFATAVSAGLALLGYGILGDAEALHRDAQIEINSIASGPDAKYAQFCKEALESQSSQKAFAALFRENLFNSLVASDEKLKISPMLVCPFPKATDTLDTVLSRLEDNPGYILPTIAFLKQTAKQLPADSRFSVIGVTATETGHGCIAPVFEGQLVGPVLNKAGFLFEPLSTTSKSLCVWINGSGRISACIKVSPNDLDFYWMNPRVLKKYLSKILAPNSRYSLRALASSNVEDFNLPALIALREEWGRYLCCGGKAAANKGARAVPRGGRNLWHCTSPIPVLECCAVRASRDHGNIHLGLSSCRRRSAATGLTRLADSDPTECSVVGIVFSAVSRNLFGSRTAPLHCAGCVHALPVWLDWLGLSHLRLRSPQP